MKENGQQRHRCVFSVLHTTPEVINYKLLQYVVLYAIGRSVRFLITLLVSTLMRHGPIDAAPLIIARWAIYQDRSLLI